MVSVPRFQAMRAFTSLLKARANLPRISALDASGRIQADTSTRSVVAVPFACCAEILQMGALDDSSGYAYISFDCDVARLAAASAGFVAGLGDRAILDEVQRVPSLFTALKQDIDRNRAPDRVLTGPPGPDMADSVTGRLEILRLHPLSQDEMHGGLPNFLDDLFAGAFKSASGTIWLMSGWRPTWLPGLVRSSDLAAVDVVRHLLVRPSSS